MQIPVSKVKEKSYIQHAGLYRRCSKLPLLGIAILSLLFFSDIEMLLGEITILLRFENPGPELATREKKAFETSINLGWKCQQILQKSFNWKYFEVTIAICCSQLMTLKALEISWCRNSRAIHEFRRRELALLHENLIVIDTFGHGNSR